MRFKLNNSRPHDGETKIEKKFALFPVNIRDNEYAFLETYCVKYEFRYTETRKEGNLIMYGDKRFFWEPICKGFKDEYLKVTKK